jgi:hypothetical protein
MAIYDAAATFTFCGLHQLKTLAQLRHDIPPAAIIQTATSNTFDARIPIATVRVWFLSPQHNLKVFKASMLGKFFFQSPVERDHIDRRTCHERLRIIAG